MLSAGTSCTRRQRDRSMLAVAYHKEPQLSAGLRGQLLCALLGGMVMTSYLAWVACCVQVGTCQRLEFAVYFTVTVAVSALVVAVAWR